MPTGYTEDIYEGKDVSGSEFLMQCARAFGATVSMRDEPFNKEIPKFEPSDYHLKAIKKSVEELEKYVNMSIEEAEKAVAQSHEAAVTSFHMRWNEKKELKSRYEKVLKEVKEWIPPTEDHIELKKYAINQLNESIKFDCSTDYMKMPEKSNAQEWLYTMIEGANKDIAYHQKEWEAEVERTNGRNKWVNELKNSLKDLK